MVVRDLARLDPGKVSIRDRDMWESRWQLLLACDGPPRGLLREVELHEIAALRASAAFSWLRANLWDAAGNAVLVLLPPARALASGKKGPRTGKAVNEALRAGFAVGMPGVIWLRQPSVARPAG